MEMQNSLQQLDAYLKEIGDKCAQDDGDNMAPPVSSDECGKLEKSKEMVAKDEKSYFVSNTKSGSVFTNIFEKSSTVTENFSSSEHNSRVVETTRPNTDAMRVDIRGTQSSGDDYFGSESSVFNISEKTNQSDFMTSVKTETLHFEESEDVVHELAEIGLNEENLQEFAASSTETISMEGNVAKVHPVSLKKSTVKQQKKSSVTTRIPQKQVTTLLDLTSIGKLKTLWAKSDKPMKKSAAHLGKQLTDTKTALSTIDNNFEKAKYIPPATVNVGNKKVNVKLAVKPLFKGKSKKMKTNNLKIKSKNENLDHLKFKGRTKPCAIRLRRIESMHLDTENLHIDLTMPRKVKILKLKKKIVSATGSSEKKIKYKHSSKVKESLKSFVVNSMKTKKSHTGENSKQKHGDKKQTAPKQIRKKPETGSNTSSKHELNPGDETKSSMVADAHNGPLCVDNEYRQQNINMPSSGEINEHFNDDDFDLSIINDQDDDGKDDDYVPSDDEKDDDYRPTLKKVKKSKPKNTNYTNLDKTGIKVTSEIGNCSEVPVKSTCKKVKGTRIGRPPVIGHFECKICGFTANEKNLIDKHHFKSHRQVLTCEPCNKKFRTISGLLEHNAYKHDGGKPFICDHEGCLYASKNPLDLERHQAKHETELKHICTLCGWRTRWRRNMKHHHALKHCDERNFKCTICEFAAKRKSDLKEHMYRHTDEKPIQCLTCGFRVKTNFELHSHMLVHSDVKPFKCTFPGCTSATKTKSDLTKHMRVHQTERPFKCKLCSKCYKDQQSINKHLSYTHMAERKYKCDTCGNMFKNRYSLKKHMNVHAGYKPFECPVCQWKFSSRNNMEKHMVTHDTSVRPYPCPLCPHASKEQDHLLAHIGTVHGNQYAYFCELCKKPFKRYMQLKLHYERMHTQKEVKDLANIPKLDLALLKMEMKLELEEAESSRKRQRKSRSKSHTLSDVDIKNEPIDEEYGDVIKTNRTAAGIHDVRLNENTGEIEVVKRNTGSRCQSKKIDNVLSEENPDAADIDGNSLNGGLKSTNNKMEVKDSVEDKNDKSCYEICDDVEVQTSGNKLENRVADKRDGKCFEKELEVVEDFDNSGIQEEVITIDDSVADVGETHEDEKCKNNDSLLIEKNDVSTVALYGHFRLPLATRGFDFNYDKNGTKPMKAWFMDVSLMDTQTAEKHKKHRRRLGLLPPIPRGHPPKGYKRLRHFVNRRKRLLAENIKKARFVKDLGLVSKRNKSRNKRFQGKYSEFETIDGEDLSIVQVQERASKIGYVKKENLKKLPPKKTSSNTCMKGKSLANSTKIKGKTKAGRPKKSTASKGTDKQKAVTKYHEKKKAVVKRTKPKTPSLLLSSEKKKQKKPKMTNVKIRKPTFLEKSNEGTADNRGKGRNSFEALKGILTDVCPTSSPEPELENTSNGKPTVKPKFPKQNSSPTKTKAPKVSKSIPKTPKELKTKEQAKPKYNKMYVPVKQPRKRKGDNNEIKLVGKKTKITELDMKKGLNSKKLMVNKQTNPKVVKRKLNIKSTLKRKLKVKISSNSPKCSSEAQRNSSEAQRNTSEQYMPHGQEATDVFPAVVHLPVQNSHVIMVYPVNVLQDDSNKDIFVAVNGDYSDDTVPVERLELKRDMNDLVHARVEEANADNSLVNISGNSDKELMQREYTESVVVKEEPLNYFTCLAQDATPDQ